MSNDRRLVTDGKVQFYEGGVKENKDEYEEPEKDIFRPPELTVEDSGNEYETELEENAPGQ